MTTITDTMRTVAGEPDNTAVVFLVPEVRSSADGTGTVTMRRVSVTPTGGAISVDLDPGLVYAMVGTGRHPFVVPASGSHRMGALIAQYLPPTTTPTQAEAAIAAYLAENPIDGGGGLTEEQIAEAATTPGAPIKTALDGSYASLTPTADYTYETAPDGSKRIKTETKNGVTMTYVYDDGHDGRIATQSNGTTTWTFNYDTDGLMLGVGA